MCSVVGCRRDRRRRASEGRLLREVFRRCTDPRHASRRADVVRSDRSAAGALIGGGPAAGVGLSAVLSAAVSYVVLLLAARTLPPADNAVFLAYWALLFGTYGLITGLYPEATRAAHESESVEGAPRPRIVPVAVSVALGLCCVLALTIPLWSRRVLGESHAWLAWVVLLAGVAYSVQFAVAGVLTARQRWNGVTTATTCEASVRLASVLIASATVGGLPSIAVASAASAVAWVLLLGRRDVQAALRAHGDVTARAAVLNYLHACAASAASAALVVGFPVLLRLTTTSDEYRAAAGLLLGVILTRAPLMVPLNAYQGVVLAHFLRHQDRGAQALLRIAMTILALTLVAAGLAAVAGPPLFGLLVGGRYALDSGVLAGLTTGAGLLALLTITGACCHALSRHVGYAVGWLGATAVACVLLPAPLPLETRTVLSLVLAPAIGCLVHTRVIVTATSRQRAARGASARGEEHARGR